MQNVRLFFFDDFSNSFFQRANNLKLVKYWQPGNMVDDIKIDLNNKYGKAEWIVNYSNDQFFLNHKAIDSLGIDLHQ